MGTEKPKATKKDKILEMKNIGIDFVKDIPSFFSNNCLVNSPDFAGMNPKANPDRNIPKLL